MSGLEVTCQEFSGPLTTLFRLLMDHELDVFSVRLAAIVDQVVDAILDPDSPLDADDAGAYLVLCSGLLRLKSRRMLPADPAPAEELLEEVEDEEAAALLHLLEYQHYRTVAVILDTLAQEASLLYPRGIAAEDLPRTTPPLEHVSLLSLVAALEHALSQRTIPVMEVSHEGYTLSQAMERLRSSLLRQGRVQVLAIFPQGSSRLDIVVTFLGLLELIRLGEVSLCDDESGNLYIYIREDGQVA